MLSYFFDCHIQPKTKIYTLNEATSKHCIQVLRMQAKDQLIITNGKGYVFEANIIQPHKKNTQIEIINEIYQPQKTPQYNIAIAPIKNNSRWEWFLEKITEIGVHTIIPIITERTEKTHNKLERQQNILISAMLQSQQAWLPILKETISFKNLFQQELPQQRFIAHCETTHKQSIQENINYKDDSLMLIGPEGDFTIEEIDIAMQHQCIPITLGKNRLRTETAAIVATTLIQLSMK